MHGMRCLWVYAKNYSKYGPSFQPQLTAEMQEGTPIYNFEAKQALFLCPNLDSVYRVKAC